MPTRAYHWIILCVAAILVGNFIGWATYLIGGAPSLHPTIIVALAILVGAFLSVVVFLVKAWRR